jgi:hypothetical protein
VSSLSTSNELIIYTYNTAALPIAKTMRVLQFLTLIASVSAFAPTFIGRPPRVALSSTQTDQETPIVINGQNIELTPSLVEYVNKRIGGTINKLASNGAVQECDVVLCVSKNPKAGAPNDWSLLRILFTHKYCCISLYLR